MYNKNTLLTIAIFFIVLSCSAQDCKLAVNGNVYDEGSGSPLPYVTIFVQELSRGTITDDNGNFEFQDICAGEYHFTISHIGCPTTMIHLDILQDTSITFYMPHSYTSLEEVVIEGTRDIHDKQPKLIINRQSLEDNTNRNLAGVLENEAGVHLIKNGSAIAKPIVHGLYGNRLTILNNGIVQSGQQWGNDHSPEIDPFAADNILVFKGANAIEYSAGNLGSVISVEPKKIAKEPHLHGQINYFYETNGQGQGLSTRLGKYTEALAWRISGTLKRYGDKKTADYFLNNTGLKEANLAFQLEKSLNKKMFLELYGSTFNTTLGVLRGSHIGNLTDLEEALAREIPFFTETDFSSEIDAPKQEVAHHLIKAKAKYYINDEQNIELVVGSQQNERKEFDIRRGDRSDIPALSLTQYATNIDLKYTSNFQNYWTLKIGSQNIITDNTNNSETGISPLIPDYITWKNGLYTTLSRSKEKVDFNLGMRYDHEYQNVQTISNSVPVEIIAYTNYFHNATGIFALKYHITDHQSIAMNTGYTMRNPAINELYSNGLHQGVSGIEEGDVNLTKEKALKNTLEYKWDPNANFSFNALAYHQRFDDFIFLNPQDEYRLTIRGAFPVFRYEQTDADIYGVDLSTQFMVSNALLFKLNYSYLKGQDTQSDKPLVFMPSNSFFGSMVYRTNKIINLTNNILLEEAEIELNNRLVLEQKNLLPEQDFVAPPQTYNLLGFKVSTNVLFSTYKIRFFVKAENLLNVQYRDYLNRQRYFADDLGVSYTMGVNFKF